MKLDQTLIVLIVAALVVIGFFFWRSKREERRIREREKERNREVPDVLMNPPPEVDEKKVTDGQPSQDPPVYELLEKERKQEEGLSSEDLKGYPKAPVDAGVQWVLEMTPQTGKVFSIGGMQSLWLELTELKLPLQLNLWARSSRDKLYYSPRHLPIEAEHIVVAVVMANREGMLDPVADSKVLQVLEQAAAHNDVDVRSSADIERVPMLAEQTRRFINYFDMMVDFLFVPQDSEKGFSADQLARVAKEAGFRHANSQWEYRVDPSTREPSMVMKFVDSQCVKFSLDVPLVNFTRGDLQRFFSLANHLSNHLQGFWLDSDRTPVNTLYAIGLEKKLKERMKMMHQHGVDAGSERATRIFARGA